MSLEKNELEIILEVTHIVNDVENINESLYGVLELLSSRAGLKHGIITVMDKNNENAKVEVAHSSGMRTDDDKEILFKLGEGITGSVAKSGIPAVIPDISTEAKFKNLTVKRDNLKGVAFICVPIVHKSVIIGTISVDYEQSKGTISLQQILILVQEVSVILSRTIHSLRVDEENNRLKHFIFNADDMKSERIIGNSSKMRDIMLLIYQVAPTDSTVLVTGETGTGKELVASEVHSLSSRSNKPFVAVNCGAIPASIIESELFGYEKGAFTGADKTKIGKIESANGGTLFLDEVGELPLDAQVKLLRVLQEKVITRVGSNVNVPVNVRVVAATNRILEDEIKEGTFREDLFYRLNVFPIYIPSLNERGSDVMLLSNYFIAKFNNVFNKHVARIDTPAIDMMMSYHWPGNVRELQNTIERAMILTTGDVLEADKLPPTLQVKSEGDRVSRKGTLKELLDNYEKSLIVDALKDTCGNQSDAAKLLGTTKRIIQYAISKNDIDYKKFRKRKLSYEK